MSKADERAPEAEDLDLLIKVLTMNFNALAAGKSDQRVLRSYSALLRFLKSQPKKFLENYRPPRDRGGAAPPIAPEFSEEFIQTSSLNDLETVINDEQTPRRQLERIAIQRFSVPRGSMRSFSNRRALTDKLRSLVENERAHQTIGEVARQQGRRDTHE